MSVHLQSAGVKQNLAQRGSQHSLVSTEYPIEACSAHGMEAIGLAHLSSPGKKTRAGDSQCLVCQGSELEAPAGGWRTLGRAASPCSCGQHHFMAWQEATLVSPDSPQAVNTAICPQGATDVRLVSDPSILDILDSSPGSTCPQGTLPTRQLDVQRNALSLGQGTP